eukprot:gene3598-6333_t
MAFGTGSLEYLLVLMVFAGLFCFVIYLLGAKAMKEKTFYWGNYHNFFAMLLTFLFSRMFVITFLMYIRYYFVPKLTWAAQQKLPSYQSLQTTGDVLVIFWEFVYILGLCVMFTWISYLIYVWKRMTEVKNPTDYPFFLIINGLLYAFSFGMLIIQLAISTNSVTWINTAFYLFGVYGIAASVLLIFYATRVSLLIPGHPSNPSMMALKRIILFVQFLGWSAGSTLMIRCLGIIIDTMFYSYLPNNSVAQTVWNIFFKFVLWIVCELLLVVFLIYAYLETDKFITELSVISIERDHGRENRISELAEEEIKFSESQQGQGQNAAPVREERFQLEEVIETEDETASMIEKE